MAGQERIDAGATDGTAPSVAPSARRSTKEATLTRRRHRGRWACKPARSRTLCIGSSVGRDGAADVGQSGTCHGPDRIPALPASSAPQCAPGLAPLSRFAAEGTGQILRHLLSELQEREEPSQAAPGAIALHASTQRKPLASASAMPLSAGACRYLPVMERAMRSARSGSVGASAFATSLSADAYRSLPVMELAMCSASVRRRAARSGSVVASASATPLSADAFKAWLVRE